MPSAGKALVLASRLAQASFATSYPSSNVAAKSGPKAPLIEDFPLGCGAMAQQPPERQRAGEQERGRQRPPQQRSQQDVAIHVADLKPLKAILKAPSSGVQAIALAAQEGL